MEARVKNMCYTVNRTTSGYLWLDADELRDIVARVMVRHFIHSFTHSLIHSFNKCLYSKTLG